jgi:hypothetical protein
MSQEPLNDPALDALAAALRGLAPPPAGLDRDALMFRAGRAAAPRRWAWPLATAASTAAAVVFGVLLWVRPEPPRVVERIVYLPAEPPSAAADEPAPPGDPGAWSRYLHLLSRDLDGLPAPPAEPQRREAPPTVESLLQSL